ncbi:MAG: hypothetical protein KF764_19150 [Labilithrix sp.]|nr:hypothetical protein [Labilithrix sp.]MBX3222476.1 hypothetical protein [Labilithrix sp.]
MRVGDASTRDGKLTTDRPDARSRREAPARASPPPPREADAPSPFARILHGLGREVDRGEALVKRVVGGGGGKEIGNLELLALQAGVYRYSEAVDLSAKLVDRAASGVKTVLQGQ